MFFLTAHTMKRKAISGKVCMTERIEQALLIIMFAIFCFAGCGVSSSGGAKVADVDYTVVSEEKIPQELKEKIEAKKEADFKMTYESGEDFYIVRGYGQQETGGYSIAVNELYQTINSVYFKTTLIGPGESQEIKKAPSYPYIVVRTGKQTANVVFD